jgi:4-hydroxy-tetrahydrodipicolinate synthase
MPVIAGSGTNSTVHTIALSQAVEAAGADALLLVTPYYNKPTQEGLYRHFMAVADAVGIPIILYNVPGRTGCDLLPATIARLSRHPRIVGVKEATGDVARAEPILKGSTPGFLLLSGDDPTAAHLMRVGACGVISVTANVAARAMHEVCAAALAGRYVEAISRNEALMPLHTALFIEANPIPVKWAVERMGLIGPGIRLPLTPLAESCRADVTSAMSAAGVMSIAA